MENKKRVLLTPRPHLLPTLSLCLQNVFYFLLTVIILLAC